MQNNMKKHYPYKLLQIWLDRPRNSLLYPSAKAIQSGGFGMDARIEFPYFRDA
jgi:hypothetical protein